MCAAELLDQIMRLDGKDRAAAFAINDSGAREVLRQLASRPLYDGDIASKTGIALLVTLGYAARWNGVSFLTQLGYAAVDSFWGIGQFVNDRH